MNPDPPRQQYAQHLEAIRMAEQRLYQEEPGCDCEPPCEGNEHQEKINDFEQREADYRLEKERDAKAFHE